MSLIEFPYISHKGYLMPIIPINILGHIFWVYIDSGATYNIINAKEAEGVGIQWQRGEKQMIIVGDGSFIPVYFHNLSIKIGEWEVTAPVGFSERLGVGFNLLGRKGVFDQFQVCFNDHTRKISFQKI